MRFFKKIMDAKSALNVVSEEIGPVELNNIQELTYYYVFSSGVASGALQPETSHASAIQLGPDSVAAFTGTWSPEGSPTASGDNVVKHVQIAGVANWRRVRISTVLAGGTVSIWAMGR